MRANEIFLKDDRVREIIGLVNNEKSVKVTGLNNSRLSFFVGNIFEELNNSIFLITYDNYRVDQLYEDLLRLLSERDINIFPGIEILPHEQIIPDYAVKKRRLSVLQNLSCEQRKNIIITAADSLVRKLIPAQLFKEYSFSLRMDRTVNLQDLIERLSLLSYQREDMVEQPGQFSIRGGIIDIYTVTSEYPYRIELFGDEVDSIRRFDPASQRSTDQKAEIIIPPADEIILFPEKVREQLPAIKEDYRRAVEKLQELGKEEEAKYLAKKSEDVREQLTEIKEFPGYEQFLPYFYSELETIFSYLPENITVVLDQPRRVIQRLEDHVREIRETEATLLEQGTVIGSYGDNFAGIREIINGIKKFKGIYITDELYRKEKFQYNRRFKFLGRGVEPYHGKLELFADRVKELATNDYRVLITLNSGSKAERITGFLQERELPAVYGEMENIGGRITVISGSLAEGFLIEDIKLAVFTEKEVIGRGQKKKRQMSMMEEGVEVSSPGELNPGDYVVHENHGIGKYRGVKTLAVQGQHQDYLVIEYAGEDKLYVPTDQVNLVQKYIGTDSKQPRLYSLGSSEWKKVKQRVKNSVREMAIGLLELYAERETIEGYAFSEDNLWQKEFEESFPYEETPDQVKAIEEVKKDMEDSTPMDRLLCGDVGFGKTEVAIRAAFKAAMDGKQTAVLVPTTILAQQHYNTFRERIDQYPIEVEMISRFKTPKEQKEILEKLALGEVDIIIGTHRLLSEDVIFADLGLLIIDEEQRFGVSHKERLKDIKRNVDVLTLSATPIPRTLHMALVGVRDMSVIETPPENRYPIRTYIREFNRELVREAIRREMSRDGQIYFVHNRVEDIDKMAGMLREMVPEARIAVAHGQMNENLLEELMYNFYNKNYDVLVCTTIIETGLDIPNVNTIIINRAEEMGLAQLYQLRGRVGRSSRIAYSYLLYEKDRILPEVAEKRLQAIKEFTNLGSGFKIAMRDLEIRGAGNLLGPEQHGHIASVGFSLYCKLLESAIEELKGEKEEEMDVEVNLNVDAYLPEEYISDSRQKIEIYKKIENSRKEKQIDEIVNELNDRFGKPPAPVLNLINIRKISIKARQIGIHSLQEKDGIVYCYFKDSEQLDGESVIKLVDSFPRRVKIRSGEKPVLGIKINNKDTLSFIQEVIETLSQFLANN